MISKNDRKKRSMDGRCVTVFAAAAAIGASFYVLWAPYGKKSKATRGDRPPGLMNLGNTCFMNSILQGIAILPSFVAWLQDFSADSDGKSLSNLAMELKILVKALNSGFVEGDDVICPDSVLSALISHGWFIPTEQQGEPAGVMNLGDIATVEKHDDSIEEDTSMVHRSKVPIKRDCCNKPHLPFHGLLASQLVCKQCGAKCPVKFDSYDSLSLSLPTTFQMGLALEDLLHMFVCSETVDAVECHGCRQQQNTDDSTSAVRTTFIKRLTLGKLPQCLCIHIQRTYWHANGVPYKNNSFIKFPEFLDMEPFLYEPLEPKNCSQKDCAIKDTRKIASLSNGGLQVTAARDMELNGYLNELATSFIKANTKSSGRAVFKLMAVVVHMGSVDDGHYVTYRRFETPQGNEHASKWIYTSDEIVEAASRDQALSSCAYMLFYERTTR
ncbi:ubiquitin carboxyl-terminal hydrolase 30 homolog isoform X3 [Orbicella faveolata]|uniref:ubiquitin carboxyl-terminal hydrolase 30 homolog isoform X3 n=1 Tax=Orbicella faveolata TaxID=48498 RepID=UPI0009E3418F|nr:ubiquitin carboxyl-terminal hydrolase 30 homolog isoform X3 [Orbicella faveolata]